MQMSAAWLIGIPSVEFSFPSRQFAVSICMSLEFLRLPMSLLFFTVFLGKSGNSCNLPDTGLSVTEKDIILTPTVGNLDLRNSYFSLDYH